MIFSKSLRLIGLIVVLTACSSLRGDTQELKRRLNEIDMKRNGPATASAALEKECLGLLPTAVTPEEKGLVYLQIAMLYSQNGLSEPARTVETCRKALEYPLDARAAVQMHIHWGDGLQMQHQAAQGDARADLRRQIADVCLRGLKRVLDQRPPEQPLPLPPVDKFDYPAAAEDATFQALVEKNKVEMAERQRVMLINDMVMYRSILVRKIAEVYLDAGADRELRDAARKVLPTEQAAADVVARIHAQTADLRAKLTKSKSAATNGP